MAIIMIRTLIIYAALLITMRLLGKRQMGEMELSEFVLAALVADLAANPLQDLEIPMLNGLVPIIVLFSCELLISGASLRHIRLRTLLFGKPSLLIVRGQIDQQEMRRSCFTVDELMQELRSKNCMDISHIEYAILETDGQLNVFPFPAHSPPTAQQLGVETQFGDYPAIIICSGRILTENLHIMGRDTGWLKKELASRGAGDASEVFLMTLNRAGQIYFAKKEGKG